MQRKNYAPDVPLSVPDCVTPSWGLLISSATLLMDKWNNSVSLPGAYQGSNNRKTQKVTEKTGRYNTNGLLKSNSGAKRPGFLR